MPGFYSKHKYKIDRFLLIAALIVFIYVFFTYLFTFFAPFFMGFVISLALAPPVKQLTARFKLSRGAAGALCLLALIAVGALLGGTIVNKIINEANSFVHGFPVYVSEMSRFVNGIAKKMETFANGISEQLWVSIENVNIFGILTSWLGTGVRNGSWSFVTNIPGFFLNLLLSFISAFFFIRDRDLIYGIVRSRTPAWAAAHFINIKKGLKFAVWGYLKAQAVIFGIVACIIIAGLLVLRYPYALFVGLLTAIVDALPVFGSGAVLWPWAAYCFIAGSFTQGLELIIINIIVTIVRRSIEPRLVGEQIGIHPLVTLMAMFIGLKLFGALGMILGPVIAIAVKVIYESQKVAERE